MRLPYANIGSAFQLDARMLGAALIEVAMMDFRGALGLGTAGADCSIRDPEKQAAGLLCALRDGQVSCHTTPCGCSGFTFSMDVAPGNISIRMMIRRCAQHRFNSTIWKGVYELRESRSAPALQPTHLLLTVTGQDQVAIFCSR